MNAVHPRVAFRLILFLFAVCPAVASTARAEAPTPPPYYAITNVRVVSGTGAVMEGATVLLAEGIIEGVGVGLSVPSDAWVIDGAGLSVYPGLIDGLTSLGLKADDEGSGRGRGGGDDEAPPIRGPEDRPQTTPWLRAADELVVDDKFGKWRKAGFTSAVSSPSQGIFAGQAALINLVDGEPDAMIVSAAAAHRLNFRGGSRRSFPGSLMGVLAYIKQVLEDTNHYVAVNADYARDPNGRVRPEFDRTLEPLARALDQGTPFMMPAQLGRHVDRAITLGQQYELRGIVVGAHGAYDRADALKTAGFGAVVSLNWPEPAKNRDPELDTPLRTLIHRRLAVSTPAALAAAGVPFAFYSDGLSGPNEVFKAIRKAVEAGLTDAQALTALTSGAAELFGVGEQLGTVEKGKIANLVLASDWPWAEDVEVAAVFVDGRRYAERKDDEPTEAPAADVSGSWKLTMQSPRGEREMTAELEMSEDGKVKGNIESQQGTTALEDGRMSGDLLRFKTTREFGGRSRTASWSLTLDGESIAGTMNAGPMSMDVSGSRSAAPSDDESDETTDQEAPVVSLDELRAAGPQIQGKVRAMGTFAVTNASVWTLAGPVIENGTVVVRNGKIQAVGRDVSIPDGAEVIDAQGGALIPGIIDCHSHMAIEGGVNEGSLNVTAMVGIGDVVNPDDIGIYRALAGGVTSANLLHGSANPIGGRNQIIKLRWGMGAEDMKFSGAPLGIKFALGENPKRSNWRSSDIPDRYPQTRMGVMDVIRQAFTEAREYQREWASYKKGAKRGGVKLAPPRRDLKLEALVEILDGERLVHSHCYRADEILQLMRLADEFGFTVGTLQHVLEGYKVADEIAAHGAGASTFSDWWGYKVEAYEAIPYNAALMSERGVVVSINSDSAEEVRHLNQEAGKCVKWGGMDEVEALKLVTLNPARQLGIDNRVGSLEVGKDADMVIYDGHPLEIASVVQKTFVDGDLYFDRETDTARQAFLEELKTKMNGPEEKKEDGGAANTETPSKPSPEVRWADEIYTCREAH